LQAVALIGVSVFVALLAVELALRVVADDRIMVWPPNLSMRYAPAPDVMPGVEGSSVFTTNEWGIRGRPFADEDRYRILTLGGSTTECLYLDDSEAWPYLLEQRLVEVAGSGVWVGNVGRAGHTARYHALQAEALAQQYPDIDAAVVLLGLNDLLLRLRSDDAYLPLSEQPSSYTRQLVETAFARSPDLDAHLPFYKRSELWRTLRRVKQALEVRGSEELQDDDALFMVGFRARRANALAVLDTLPDLTVALDDYRGSLERIVTALESQGVLPILATQPTLWRSDLSEAEEALLWFGRRGNLSDSGNEFYSAGALDEGMRAFNDVLRSVCAARALTCVDLEASLPKDTTVYYDDAHFNESGARMVADAIARTIDVPARSGQLGQVRVRTAAAHKQ